MPFTGSHPAAVLPFLRSPMPASALVIGSMSPDVPLYLPMPYSTAFSHDLAGTVTVDLVCGLALFALWRSVVCPFALDYAPAGIADRVRTRGPVVPSRPPWIIAGLCLGALTHVAWDAFTHADGWSVRRLALLRGQAGALPVYEWAQYTSGLLGAAVLAMWIARWYRATRPDGGAGRPPESRARRGAVYGIVAALTLAGAVFGWWDGRHQPDPVRSAFFRSATNGVDAGFAGLLVVACVRSIQRRRVRSGDDPGPPPQ